MNKPKLLHLKALTLCFFASASLFASSVVHIESGDLRGSGSNIRAFLGIPYAAPPVGEMRWRPPQKPAPWTSVRDATHFAHPCAQAHNPDSSEDCLYLNVWTPAASSQERLPVMVWIHGGGFVAGSVSSPKYAGTHIAEKGVVVVTLNYRLGVFGFLAHPDLTAESPHHASGNYGLMDQLFALRWVQNNIAAFGGDPQNVTVFGESAGATSIGYLLVSPLAKSLFQKAILESPSRVLLPDPELNKIANGLTPMETVGEAITPHIAEARKWTTEETLERAKVVTDTMFAPGGEGRIGLKPEGHMHIPDAHDAPWWAFVDGWVIPEQTQVAYREGKQLRVPVLAGTNANEGSVFLRHFPVQTEEQYRQYLDRYYAPCGKTMFALYPAHSPSEIRAAVDQIITDALFLYGVYGIAQAEQTAGQPVFLYRFSRTSIDPKAADLGAWHGAEIPYVFGIADPNLSPGHFDAKDKEISEQMMSAWTHFAKTGDPNSQGVPRWPAARKQNEMYMDFGDTTAVHRLMKQQNFAVFQQVFAIRKQ